MDIDPRVTIPGLDGKVRVKFVVTSVKMGLLHQDKDTTTREYSAYVDAKRYYDTIPTGEDRWKEIRMTAVLDAHTGL